MTLFSAAKRFLMKDDGQGNTEYIILIGVVALGAIGAAYYFRSAIVDGFTKAADWLRSAF
jgi:Flp pilus assembly pilin Flp